MSNHALTIVAERMAGARRLTVLAAVIFFVLPTMIFLCLGAATLVFMVAFGALIGAIRGLRTCLDGLQQGVQDNPYLAAYLAIGLIVAAFLIAHKRGYFSSPRMQHTLSLLWALFVGCAMLGVTWLAVAQL